MNIQEAAIASEVGEEAASGSLPAVGDAAQALSVPAQSAALVASKMRPLTRIP
jgi:hypothetical protein